jgi:hypothetical protein
MSSLMGEERVARKKKPTNGMESNQIKNLFDMMGSFISYECLSSTTNYSSVSVVVLATTVTTSQFQRTVIPVEEYMILVD